MPGPGYVPGGTRRPVYRNGQVAVPRQITSGPGYVPEEDYSDSGAFQRARQEVAYDSAQEYYADYPVVPNATPNPREYSAILRYQRANANRLILSQIPDTLDRYPSLVDALAQTDIDEQDARRLINLAEMDSAFNAITATTDPVRQRNIILSMNPVQRAAFFDYFTAKAEELQNEAAKNPGWAEQVWDGFYGGVVEPIINGLVWANEKSQQAWRGSVYGIQEGLSEGNLFKAGASVATGSVMYWDEVAPGTYNQETLEGLRAEYGADKVNALLRLEELKRDGEPDAYGRWIAEYVNTPLENLVRDVTWSKYEDPTLIELSRKINAADQGNTGMLLLSPLPDDWSGDSAYDVAAGALNVTATLTLDPTLFAAKGIATYRAARYGLTKLSTVGGVDSAFRMRRTRVFFDSLGKDLARIDDLEPAKAAIARDVMRRQYGNYLPAQVIDDMAEFGVRSADDAQRWFTSKYVAEQILAGVGVGDKFGTAFEQIARATNLAKRQPLMPGKTTAGVIRSRVRLLAAIHNPVNNRFAEQFAKRFDEASDYAAGSGVDASAYGARLSDDAAAYGAEQGVIERVGPLGEFARRTAAGATEESVEAPTRLQRVAGAVGYRYTDKSMSARLDRITRRFARAPIPTAVYMNDGRDAGLIYDWARAFMTRQDAAMVENVWRTAESQAVRKQIFNGLVKTHAAAKGVMLKNPQQSWRDFLPEVKRGGTYSPTLQMRRTEDGMLVWDRTAEAVSGIDDEVKAFAATGEDLLHGTVSQFDTFESGARNRYGRPSNGVFYFTDDAEIANRFGPARRTATLEPESLGRAIDDFDLTEYSALDAAGKAAMDSDFRAYLVERLGSAADELFTLGDDGAELIPLALDNVTVPMLWDYAIVRVARPDARVVQAKVYGKTLDLTPPGGPNTRLWTREEERRVQEWYDAKPDAEKQLLADRFSIPVGARPDNWKNATQRLRDWGDSFSHESDVRLHEWMRSNGYGKARVIDNAESGGKSVIALPEMIGYGTSDPVAAYRASLEASTSSRALADAEDIISIRPSDFNGQQYPLHLWQTSDYVKTPNFAELEKAGVRASFLGAAFGLTHGKVAQRIVDTWSLFTLAGPRYYLRNSLEDYVFYAMTEGQWRNLYKGRRFGTALRDVRGKKLGIVNRLMRGKARPIDDPDFSTKWSLIKSNFTEEDRVAAMQAMKEGDLSKVRDLVALSMARSKLTGWSKANQDDLMDFVTEHGAKLLDEVNEEAMFGVSALMPGTRTESYKMIVDATDGATGAKLVRPSREWGDVSPIDSKNNPLALSSWLRDLTGVTYDGPIGQAALKGIYFGKSDEELIPQIAGIIRSDKTMKYTDRLAAFHTANASPEQFAARYVSDVRNMVSRPDGTPNEELLKLMRGATDSDAGIQFVMTADGLSVKDLAEIRLKDRPTFILGQTVEEVPVVNSIKAFDRLWAVMGEQYARLSREPIFLANYLEQRTILRPYEQQMASMFGAGVARQRASRLATDRAYELTLSYTDNPLNRTMLAWNSRNVARYYRATEDFARRALRVTKNYPQGFWKVGLTYDALDDTGFVYTDENGEKYFMFPGTDMTIGLVNAVINKLPAFNDNGAFQLDSASYEMRGYVRMLSPSADPYQWLPTLSSPIAAVGVKSLMAAFPMFNSLEQALLGEYGENADFWQAMMPSHALRAFALLNTDERSSAYASAFKDAVQVSAAAGAMPAFDAPQSEWDDYQRGLGNLVRSLIVTRAVLGFFLPAAPRLTATDVTDFAREGGILNMDAAFREMIRVAYEEGSQNPFADGLTKYVETFGLDAVPYTLSTSEANDQFGSLTGLTSVAATVEGEQWVKENYDLVDGRYKTASMWLMPRLGEYSADQNQWLRKAGMKIPARYEDLFNKARVAEGKYVYYMNRDLAMQDIDAAKKVYYDAVVADDKAAADAAWAEVRRLEDEWSGDGGVSDKIKATYPELKVFDSIELANGERLRLLDVEIRPMLDYVLNERDKPAPAGAQNMADAIATFDAYQGEIGKITGQTAAENLDKRMLKIEAQQMLTQVGERDPNTKFFVDAILIPMMNQSYTPLVGSQQ